MVIFVVFWGLKLFFPWSYSFYWHNSFCCILKCHSRVNTQVVFFVFNFSPYFPCAIETRKVIMCKTLKFFWCLKFIPTVTCWYIIATRSARFCNIISLSVDDYTFLCIDAFVLFSITDSPSFSGNRIIRCWWWCFSQYLIAVNSQFARIIRKKSLSNNFVYCVVV